ncbi:MAG: hypothetical protein AAFV29_07320 [Myxococcota bacterium]
MELIYAAIAGGALVGIAIIAVSTALQWWRVGRVRLPRRLSFERVAGAQLPEDARAPLSFLRERLRPLGFTELDGPVLLSSLNEVGHRLWVVPFVHEGERAYFFLGIDAAISPSSELAIHIVTPLVDDRRVETTTLEILGQLIRPEAVAAQVVLDADSVEEIWSRHRRALTKFERAERVEVRATDWAPLARAAYESWLRAAVRSQRIILDHRQQTYRVRRSRRLR